MRLAFVLAAVAVFLTIADFALARGEVNSTDIETSNFIESTGQQFIKNRGRGNVDGSEAEHESPVGEERFFESLLQQASTLLSKLANLNLFRMIDDMKLAKLMAKEDRVYDDLYGIFEKMKRENWNPNNLAERFGIPTKLRATPHDKLMKTDDDYALWTHFRDYWIKFYPESKPTIDIFRKMEAEGKTPAKLKLQLKILKKINEYPDGVLMHDADYVLFIRFTEWWIKRRPKTTKIAQPLA